MARLNSPKRTLFSETDFLEYPVWTWDDEHEGYLPISEDTPSPSDYEILFIKSYFKTNTCTFFGFITYDIDVYAFGIFISNVLVTMNLNLPGLAKERIKEIFQLLNCASFNFFPLSYESEVVLKGGQKISGTLDLKIE